MTPKAAAPEPASAEAADSGDAAHGSVGSGNGVPRAAVRKLVILPKLRLVPLRLAVGALAACFVIVAVAWLVSVQLALVLFATLALGGAIARIVMPAKMAFAIRRRAVDVATLAILGGVLLFLAFATPLE
ncbi:hypothetical protein [Demequina oxidasica]|uniref:hypothetical protein n=1 Tax=Demequina oxidasica TaxID=676199 RepID=UPI000781AD67|nr:hypothetical protein [Demequina oxidasica]